MLFLSLFVSFLLSLQKALFSRAMKISEMRDSVHRKRLELELLRRSKTLSIVLEAQVRTPMILNASFIFCKFTLIYVSVISNLYIVLDAITDSISG